MRVDDDRTLKLKMAIPQALKNIVIMQQFWLKMIYFHIIHLALG